MAKGWSPDVALLVYPAPSSDYTLYEDDGESLAYRKGAFALTHLTCETVAKTVKLKIGGRRGGYADMPATRNFTATIYLPARPHTVTRDSKPVTDYQWSDAACAATIKIPACGKTPTVVTLQ